MRRPLVALLVPVLAASAALAGSAAASDHRQISHGLVAGPDDGGGKSHLDQHGPSSGHLPASSENVDLVGKLRLTSFEEDISDVSALQAPNGRWFAYVGDWG